MKSLVAILLASLCLFAHATSVYQTPAFLELQKKPLGMVLTNMIQVNMQSKQVSGRLDAVNVVLQQVAASLADQQQANENNFQAETAAHNDMVATLQGQLDQAHADLEHYQQEDRDLAAEKTASEESLASEQWDLQANTNSKVMAEEQLVGENVRNEQAVREYAEAIQACEESLRLLGTLVSNQSSFIQSKAKFNNVVALLQKHLSNKTSPLIAPVVSVLSELALSTSEVDQVQLNKVVNLINQLLDELRNQEAANVVNHNRAVEDLTNQINALVDLINKNNSAIEQLQNRLAAIADRQSQLVDIINNLQQLIPVVEGQLNDENNHYAEQESNYNNVRNQLNHDVDALEKVREYFNLHVVTSVQNIDDDVYNDQLSA